MILTTSCPLPTPTLARRLIDVERECMTDWLNAMAELPGNPLGAYVGTFGNAAALVCRSIDAQVFNRVIGFTANDHVHIPAILDFYAQHGMAPLFDLSPYEIPPYWTEPNVPRMLAQHGFYQGASHQMLYGVPVMDEPPLPAYLTVREVGLEDAEAFIGVYAQVWGGGEEIRVLLGKPRFRCYLAYVNAEPAALGVLHIAHNAGSMANGLTIPAQRGKGCQTALLRRRMADAARAGCDLVVSQCTPGVTSQNNQMRVGFHIAGTNAWWVPMSE